MDNRRFYLNRNVYKTYNSDTGSLRTHLSSSGIKLFVSLIGSIFVFISFLYFYHHYVNGNTTYVLDSYDFISKLSTLPVVDLSSVYNMFVVPDSIFLSGLLNFLLLPIQVSAYILTSVYNVAVFVLGVLSVFF